MSSEESRGKSTCGLILNTLKSDWVLILTVVGIVVGFTVGLAIRPAEPSDDVLMWIGNIDSEILCLSTASKLNSGLFFESPCLRGSGHEPLVFLIF